MSKEGVNATRIRFSATAGEVATLAARDLASGVEAVQQRHRDIDQGDIGLKGFVAAIMGGLASFPLAAAGALLVGVLESLGSFWASAYRDVIVFTLLIPVLVWLSLRAGSDEERA